MPREHSLTVADSCAFSRQRRHRWALRRPIPLGRCRNDAVGAHSATPSPSTNLDMHVHAYYIKVMRTTIEIPDEQRAQLLEIAGARGEKGYSRLVQEAIGLFLRERRRREDTVKAALAQRGALNDDEADEFEERIRQIRKNWR